MKIRKLASLLTITALSASLLVACGNNNDNDVTDDKDNNGQVEENEVEENGEVEEDALSGASITADPAEVVQALSADGSWIVALTDDVTIEENVTVEGDFHNRGDANNELHRKLALYTQDDDRNVTDEFTLTVPELTVKSPNFRIQNGTVKGNVIVEAEGFELSEATVDGDVTFATQELKDSAKIDEGEVTGEVKVAE